MSKYVLLNINKTSRSFYYLLVSTLQRKQHTAQRKTLMGPNTTITHHLPPLTSKHLTLQHVQIRLHTIQSSEQQLTA